MRMGFVLFAYDPEDEKSVPIARVIITKKQYEWFRDAVWNGLKGYDLMVHRVVEGVRECCPDLLVPFDFDGGRWQFHLNAEGVAAVQGVDLHGLPTIDMT